MAVARDLFFRGARVVLACRNVDSGLAAVSEIVSEDETSTSGEMEVRGLDLSCSADVRRFCLQLVATEERCVSVLRFFFVAIGSYAHTSYSYNTYRMSC